MEGQGSEALAEYISYWEHILQVRYCPERSDRLIHCDLQVD